MRQRLVLQMYTEINRILQHWLINLNPSMDKWLHPLLSMRWNYLFISKFQRLHRWNLRMDKKFQITFCWACYYLPILGLKLTYVKVVPCRKYPSDPVSISYSDVTNHCKLDCLFNRSTRLTSWKYQSSARPTLCEQVRGIPALRTVQWSENGM